MNRDDAIAALTSPGQPYELSELEVHGRRVRTFVNAPASLREIYEAARSDLPFIVYDAERLTFEDVWRRSANLATALVADYGVGKGDRVAIAMRNYPEWIIAFNAATSIGAIAVGMNAQWQAQEMEFALGDCRPKVLIADGERLDRIAAFGAPQDLAVIAVRGGHTNVRTTDFNEVLSRSGTASMPAVDLHPDSDAIMLYTSGSTGHPKGVVSSHRNIISALFSWELEGQVNILRGIGQQPLRDAPQPAALLAIPLFHVSGLHGNLLQSYRAQRSLVCMYKWDPYLAADLIERERVTYFNAPPAVTGDLVRVARSQGRDLASLVAIGGGGATRAPEQVRAIAEAFPSAAPGTGWGMTETNAIGVGIAGSDYLEHPASSGRVSPVLDIRIVDDDGREAPPMTRGELQIRGASIMRGYWERPEANAEAFIDGWMHTGDVAYIDDEGFVYVVDRIKDLIIRGGENIGCGTVEAALLEHPDVVEASVYGVPDERLGEEVSATLYVTGTVDEPSLRAFLAPRLARFEIPAHFHFTDCPLPRIASGKILKRQLRDEATRRLAAVHA